MIASATHQSSCLPAINELLRPCENSSAWWLLSGIAALVITLGLAALMSGLISAHAPLFSDTPELSAFTVQSIELAPIVPPTKEPKTAPEPPAMTPSPAAPTNPMRIRTQPAPILSNPTLMPRQGTPSLTLGPLGTMPPSSAAVRRSAAPVYPMEAR